MVTVEKVAAGGLPQNGVKVLEITRGPNGYKLDMPVRVELPADADRATEDTYNFIIQSLLGCTPRLIPFACGSESIFNMAKYLRRSSSSRNTLRNYVWGVSQFCKWAGRAPDDLIHGCMNSEGLLDPRVLAARSTMLDDFVGALTADGLAETTIGSYVKGVKALYRANNLSINLSYRLKKRVRYEDRAPTPEELSKLIDLADLRDKVVVSCLALGAFRIDTLVQLKYRHVKADLERGVVPIHVHVEAEITKGKYCNYDTFLGGETVDYLRTYLDVRRRGSMRRQVPADKLRELELGVQQGERGKKLRQKLGIDYGFGMPPENITDESPLIRDAHSLVAKPITSKRISNAVHSLYIRAGLVSKGVRQGAPRTHSIRKFFRTQLAALGVNNDYIEYMMGHRTPTYHDIHMKGVEFLRRIYMASGLSIKPKTKASRIDVLNEMLRAWGVNPDEVQVKEALKQVLGKEAFAEPHRAFVSPRDYEESQVKALSAALREAMRKELLDSERKST